MAKECAFCGKKLGAFDSFHTIPNTNLVYCVAHSTAYSKFCNDLKMTLSANPDGSTYAVESDLKKSLGIVGASATFYQAVDTTIRDAKRDAKKGAALRAEQENADHQRKAVTNLMLTTGSSFDGYVVDRYIDVIYEEIIFKNSFTKQIGAAFEDFGNALSFREREMTGSADLISRARKVLMEKFRLKAVRMGANAILGIDFETSFGSDIVRAAVNGTAVVIRKKDDVQ